MPKRPLEANDFPIESEKQTLKTCNGKKIASAPSKELAEEIADRLNEQAHREEEDRWA